jgi:DNA-binding transcriptional MerR regulator
VAATDQSFDLPTLCDLAGVTPRTVRYYMQQGLLPQPGAGREARKYGPGTLMRLRLIRQLQREHLPLAAIRARLETLSDDAVAALLEPEQRSPREPLGSARDYLDAVLGTARAGMPPAPRRESRARPTGSPRGSVADGALPPALQPPTTRTASEPAEAWPRGREQWERLRLHADVELHVRRPASRDLNRRLERLLEEARRILNDE